MSEALAVSVVVPAFNAASTIARTLEALAEQDLEAPFEVIVVDDGSDDGTPEIAARGPGRVRVVTQDREGAAAARNRGVAEAKAEVIAFTDADCFPTGGWLREGLAALADADIVQGPVRADPGAPRGPYDRTLWVLRETGLYESANLFIRRTTFDAAGGFEDWLRWRLDIPVGEDTWLVWRARRDGARTRFAEPALVHHAVFARSPAEYVVDRWHRLQQVAATLSKVPELRTTMLYRRFFLSQRTAEFDLALAAAGLAAGLALAAGPLAAIPPIVAMAPYARTAYRRARPFGRRRLPALAAVDLLADACGMVALLRGSVRWRRLVA